MAVFSLEDFASGAPALASDPSGNTDWARLYARELKDTVLRYAARMPRNVQRHLGPSELGHECDRMLVGKMAGSKHASLNHVSDPWAAIVGTAIHAFLEDAFNWDNSDRLAMRGYKHRWTTERKVCPDPDAIAPHPGTADLYDHENFTLVDHKGQSEGMRAKLRLHGPPQHYYIQLMLYATGYMHAGYRVDRVALASWPRTKSSLDDMYVWEKTIDEADLAAVREVLRKTSVREQIAAEVKEGRMSVYDIPPTPSEAECIYCPLYRPQSARDGLPGCPGTLLAKMAA